MTNERKTKTVQNSRTSNSTLSQGDIPDGVQTVSPSVGSDVPPIPEGKAELVRSAPAAAVPTQRGFASVRSSNREGGAKTVASIEEYHVEGLAARAEEIDAQYADYEIEGGNLPQTIIDTAQQWLRSHNLIWASNDLAFWNALEYVLDSLESFSIDAVEQALIICTTEAFDDAARRSTIYQELRACRALKKIRDLQLKIRTAQVVATRTLSAPHALAIKQQREADAAEAAEAAEDNAKRTRWNLEAKQAEDDYLEKQRPSILQALKTPFEGDRFILAGVERSGLMTTTISRVTDQQIILRNSVGDEFSYDRQTQSLTDTRYYIRRVDK